ncbi:hypothetical protein [Agrilutibacter solisilvae]|uniref:Uncharacterized protein n=1 Tax=Agrilutibacter solisilvae TaxID=2763317 RepID=A0A974Y051_9GAMM|nr:hypothetical protein [Lysobacter solisilvae]QSX78972.1 hypothetical protein I8J32_003340 [Lysobacter solisilvae]
MVAPPLPDTTIAFPRVEPFDGTGFTRCLPGVLYQPGLMLDACAAVT